MFLFATTANPDSSAGAGAGARVTAAARDALTALKQLATNPVAGLAGTFDTLGPTRALGAGIVFGAACAIAMLIGVYRYLPAFIRPSGVGGFLQMLLFAVVPFVALAAANFVVRMAFRGQGSLGTDGFIAGAALLPFTVVALAVVVLGPENIRTVSIIALFAICITILMLFAGLTRINKISERAATLAVPLIVMANAWFTKIIYSAMLRGM